MKRASVLAAVSLLAVASLARRGDCATAPLGKPADHLVELRFDEAKEPDFRAARPVQLDKDGRGGMPFPTRSGKLRVRLSGGKLVCDANGDGIIDEADGGGVSASASRGLFDSGMASRALRVRVSVAGRSVEYPIAVLFAQERFAVLASAAVLRGEFRGADIRLYDTNMNGVFGEVGADKARVDEGGREGAPRDRVFRVDTGPRLLGRTVAVGGDLFSLGVVEGGKALRLSPFTGDKATLALKVDEGVDHAVLGLSHVDALFFGSATVGKELVLPAGKYRIGEANLALAPPGGAKPAGSWLDRLLGRGGAAAGNVAMLMGSGGGDAPLVTIRPGRNELSPGPPFKLDFTAYVRGDRKGLLEIKDAALVGGAGERYRAQLIAGDAEGSLRSYVRAGGKEKALSKLEYG